MDAHSEKDLTNQEGFEIIQRMINTAKNQFDDSSFYYLLWGWLVLAASLGHFVLLRMQVAHPYVVWILMPLGGVVTMAYAFKHERHKKVRSYIDQLMAYVLIAFLVSLAIALAFMGTLKLNAYPVVLIIYAVWLFVSGGALRFRPLIIGGILNWACAVAAFFAGYETQLLLLAFAVLSGYIIPGHLLRSRSARRKSALT